MPNTNDALYAMLLSLLGGSHHGGPMGIPGMTAVGNIDPLNRPVVQNPDGSYSTTVSTSIGFPEGEVLLPTVVDDRATRKKGQPQGHFSTGADAAKAYQSGPSKGKHLGIFGPTKGNEAWQNADNYAEYLHNWQQTQMNNLLSMLLSQGL